MSKIYKLEMYVIDHNDIYDCYDSISDILENTTDLSCEVINESKVEFEWEDELPINKMNCPLGEYEKYFKEYKKDNIRQEYHHHTPYDIRPIKS